MAISYQVLGEPGRDNALYVELHTGQAVHRLLFDCGEGCLDRLSVGEIQGIDTLLFSHFHIDHIAGFDGFLRSNYSRLERPLQIWGPAGAVDILGHRLQGFTWNLVAGLPGEFIVSEIHPDRIVSARFLTHEGFSVAHPAGERPFEKPLVNGPDFRIDARLLDHGTPSAAYSLREKPRTNVDPERLARLGLAPGPWLKHLKDPATDPQQELEVGQVRQTIDHWRRQLLASTPGESIAYVTDFRLDPASEDELTAMLGDCGTLVCENSFSSQDQHLAERTFHVTSADVGRLAARVRPGRLILFHLSDRYTPAEWRRQLEEVQTAFPAAAFPESWNGAIGLRPDP